MSFLSIFSDEHGFIATRQRIYAPSEISRLNDVFEMASYLESQLANQSDRLAMLSDQVREKAYAEGLAEGRAEATREYLSSMSEFKRVCAKAVDELQASSGSLAIDIVRKIAGEVDQIDWFIAQAHQVAKELTDEPVVKLRVNPEHVAALKDKLRSQPLDSLQLVVADEYLNANECILETSAGCIDVSLETQLASIQRIVEENCVNSDYHAG